MVQLSVITVSYLSCLYVCSIFAFAPTFFKYSSCTYSYSLKCCPWTISVSGDGLLTHKSLFCLFDTRLSTNLTRIEASQNKKVLRQLNHSPQTLEFLISRLQLDRNFVMSILQICSHLFILLVGIIQLNGDLDAVNQKMTTLTSNTLSPMIISPSDLRKLLTEVEIDLTDHPKLGLPTSYDGKIFGLTINY